MPPHAIRAVRAVLLALLAAPATAEPVVVADTAPVHSLVAKVMAGVGEPQLLLPHGEPPHDASLRPSEARMLSGADVVVWTGPALLPWMPDALGSLAPDARTLELLATPGWEPLPVRSGGLFAPDEHGEGHDGGHGEGHDGHDHAGDIDPHAWLDPAVAAVWTEAIADALAAADPANDALYHANAAGAATLLRMQGRALAEGLAPLRGRGWAVDHDALQYFERATGLKALGAAGGAHGGAVPAASLLSLRAAALDGSLSCLLVEPNADPSLAAALGEGTALRTATVDPEGLALKPGPTLIHEALNGVADALESCLR